MKVSGKQKILTSILLLLIIASCLLSVPVKASERCGAVESNSQIAPLWSYLNSVDCYFTITSDGMAKIDATVAAKPTNTSSVKISALLQRKNSSGNWVYVRSFSSKGKTVASIWEEYPLSYRGKYKLTVTAIANNSEQATITRYAEY